MGIIPETCNFSESTCNFNFFFEDEKFDIHVSNTGPAVIGSEIDFLAELSAETIVTEKKRFLYHWMNDADNTEKLEATNNYKSNISSYIFDSELILPNKYKMKVCVYKRHKEFYVKVAENHTLFELTVKIFFIIHNIGFDIPIDL